MHFITYENAWKHAGVYWRSFLQYRGKNRVYPASTVLNDYSLVQVLVYDGENEPSEWSSMQYRREWLNKLIKESENSKIQVKLVPDSSHPPLHALCF